MRNGRKSLNQQLGVGVLLDLSDVGLVLEGTHQVDWLEIVSEHLISNTRYGHTLRLNHEMHEVFERFPISLHGIELSIGSTDPLPMHYLKQLKRLIRIVDPIHVSDHLCWTGVGGVHTHELLPLPLTEEALRHVAKRVTQVQDFLGVQISLENPPNYVTFAQSEMSEGQFMAALADEADCGLLIDVCNLKINALNNHIDALAFLREIPPKRVTEFHLIGYERHRSFAVDTHSRRTSADVMALYRAAIAQFGKVSTIIEWDQQVPSFGALAAEAARVRAVLQARPAKAA